MDNTSKKHSTTKGYITKTVLAGLTIFLLFFCSRAYALFWLPPQAIVDADSYFDGDIAVDPNGNWHIVYSEWDLLPDFSGITSIHYRQ